MFIDVRPKVIGSLFKKFVIMRTRHCNRNVIGSIYAHTFKNYI